jgi:hypothetical protein
MGSAPASDGGMIARHAASQIDAFLITLFPPVPPR